MPVLGAIFAGGAARRFGSDKAAAPINGRPMIEHVARRLAAQCDALIIVGRSWPGIVEANDRPRPGLGPLGALAGALSHADTHGYDLVLTSGCDLPDLPTDLLGRLAPAPAVVRGQPLLGLWRARDAGLLVRWLESDGDRAMRAWIADRQARVVPLEQGVTNINTTADYAAYIANRGDGA